MTQEIYREVFAACMVMGGAFMPLLMTWGMVGIFLKAHEKDAPPFVWIVPGVLGTFSLGFSAALVITGWRMLP